MHNRSSWLLALLIMTAPTPSHAQNSAVGQLITQNITAPSLRNNVLGDPAEQRVVVYLPPSYQTDSARSFPVVYLLHGIGGSPEDWAPDGFQGMNIQLVLDSLIAARSMREMIVVMPNGANKYLGAFYLNSSVTGNWENYIVNDVVNHVDRTYRTIRHRDSRGIAGHSMGGFGAVMMGIRHSTVFGSVYALSPCCLGMVGDLSPTDAGWRRLAAYKSWDDLLAQPGKAEKDLMPIAFVALAAAISPNPNSKPYRADIPIVPRNGRLVRVEPAFAKWRAAFPLPHVGKSRTALRSLRGIALDVGYDDQFSHITLGTRMFSDSLAHYQVPHTFELYAGDHANRIRERLVTRVFPFFSALFTQ